MKKALCCFTITLILALAFNVQAQSSVQAEKLMKSQGIKFVENKGQLASADGKSVSDIAFTAKLRDAEVYARQGGLSFIFSKEKDRYRMDMNLIGANLNAPVRGEEELRAISNFYTSQNPMGFLGVRSFKKIVYENIYSGIDFVLYEKDNDHLEYDFVVKPGANPDQIRVRFDYAEKPECDNDGRLIIRNPLGKVEKWKPYTYQDIAQSRKEIQSSFSVSTDGVISFDIAQYDRKKTLIIDPMVRLWGTYYGGNGMDWIWNGLAVDKDGNIYIAGYTNSTDVIGVGGYQSNYVGGDDAFIAKFDKNDQKVWSTYYGGNGGDYAQCVAVDDFGNVYIGGQTSSDDLIGVGGWQSTKIGIPGFIAKFNSNGQRVWGTYYGGSTWDSISGIAVDKNQNVYVLGGTRSTDVVGVGGWQSTYGGLTIGWPYDCPGDVFIAKFDVNGQRVWGTYYGGIGRDDPGAMALDSSGNIYITGDTQSPDVMGVGGWQSTYGGNDNPYFWGDAFIAKFSNDGQRIWGTYYGGSGYDTGLRIAVDKSSNIIIAGQSRSTNVIGEGGWQSTMKGGESGAWYGGGNDAFVAKFSNNGQRIWGTYFGGTGMEANNGLALDADGNIYLAGNTTSSDLISDAGLQTTKSADNDVYIVKFNPNGQRVWGTYYGGDSFDALMSFVVDGNGNIYVGGLTNSTDVMGVGGYQSTFGGGQYDIFIAKFRDTSTPVTNCFGNALEFDGNDVVIIGQGENDIFNQSEFTVEGWFYPTGLLPSGSGEFSRSTIVWNGDSKAWYDPYWIYLRPDGYLEVRLHYADTPIQDNYITSDHELTLNNWYHFALVVSGKSGIAHLFINGVLQAAELLHSTPVITNASFLSFGQVYDGNNSWGAFNGLLDEIRIWTIARSQAEILNTMRKSLIGNEYGLAGYWKFDEGSGQIAHDSSSTAKYGQLGFSDIEDDSDPKWRNDHIPINCEDKFNPGTFTVDSTGIVKIDWLYDGGKYQGEFGIFSLTGMENLTPGSSEFIAEAVKRALSNSEQGYVVFSDLSEGARFSGILGNEIRDWNAGPYKGLKSFAMKLGDQFATILVPNSTFQSLAQNPATTDTNKRPLFSLVSENPAYGMYFGQMVDINGMGKAFAYEDKDAATSDWDFNDLIVQIIGAESSLPTLDSLVGNSGSRSKRERRDNSFTDWRINSELGKLIMSHVEAPAVTENTPRITVTLKASAKLLVYDPSGNVMGKEGGRIAGAAFELNTDGSQTISLNNLNPGNYRIVIQSAENVQGSLTVKAYQGDAEISSNDTVVDIQAHQIITTTIATDPVLTNQPLAIEPAVASSYDFNGDGVIDNNDVSMLVRHWNSCRNQQKFDAFFDLDNNGCITVADVMKVLNARTAK